MAEARFVIGVKSGFDPSNFCTLRRSPRSTSTDDPATSPISTIVPGRSGRWSRPTFVLSPKALIASEIRTMCDLCQGSHYLVPVEDGVIEGG
jgi:hypothetical protein